jgi:hypothetical protein
MNHFSTQCSTEHNASLSSTSTLCGDTTTIGFSPYQFGCTFWLYQDVAVWCTNEHAYRWCMRAWWLNRINCSYANVRLRRDDVCYIRISRFRLIGVCRFVPAVSQHTAACEQTQAAAYENTRYTTDDAKFTCRLHICTCAYMPIHVYVP